MTISEEVKKINAKLISVRRQLHQNPELGFQEFETAKLIQGRLTELGIEYRAGIAKTGIVGVIHGKNPGKRLLIRADMDALPLQEENEVEYKSQNEGIMHACGHDSHVACLLGVAEILVNMKDQLDGTVYLLFQPAEETSPLGYYDVPGGAAPMIQEGAIGDPSNPNIDAAIALHVTSQHPIGKIAMTSGPAMGSADEIIITIKGKGGHGSAPHKAIDPIYIASQICIGVQGYLSRTIDPVEPKVFTIGKITAGDRHNIISEHAVMEGTFRTLSHEVRTFIKQEIPKVIRQIAQTYGGNAEVEIVQGYPVGVNDPSLSEMIKEVVITTLGKDSLLTPPSILGAEDFYEFSLNGKIPVAMFFLGGGNANKGFTSPNHSNYFDFDEDALAIGTTVLIEVALKYLAS